MWKETCVIRHTWMKMGQMIALSGIDIHEKAVHGKPFTSLSVSPFRVENWRTTSKRKWSSATKVWCFKKWLEPIVAFILALPIMPRVMGKAIRWVWISDVSCVYLIGKIALITEPTRIALENGHPLKEWQNSQPLAWWKKGECKKL